MTSGFPCDIWIKCLTFCKDMVSTAGEGCRQTLDSDVFISIPTLFKIITHLRKKRENPDDLFPELDWCNLIVWSHFCLFTLSFPPVALTVISTVPSPLNEAICTSIRASLYGVIDFPLIESEMTYWKKWAMYTGFGRYSPSVEEEILLGVSA